MIDISQSVTPKYIWAWWTFRVALLSPRLQQTDPFEGVLCFYKQQLLKGGMLVDMTTHLSQSCVACVQLDRKLKNVHIDCFSPCCLCNCPILLVKLSPSNCQQHCQHQVFFFLKLKLLSSLLNDESREGVSLELHHLREILFHLWEHLHIRCVPHLCPRLGPLQHLSYT